ncbi:hypothetical protein FRC07_013388, partial [Ceratobasidium sp. 392]
MDVLYLSQLPVHTERSLADYRQAYADLMTHRWAWVENGTRKGKKVVIKHFNIPKMHVMRHLDEHIQQKGSADNFSTETMEHLHGDVKEAYRASNRREWKRQTVRWLTRREKMWDFEEWMRWCNKEAGCEFEPEYDVDWEDDVSESEIGSDDDSDAEIKSEAETEVGDLGEVDDSTLDGPEYDNESDAEYELDQHKSDNWDNDWDNECDVGELVEFEGRDEAEYTHPVQGGHSVDKHDYITTYLQCVHAAQRADVEEESVGIGSRGQKRKHPGPDGAGLIGDNPTRSLPRPRLQDSHALSDLQKINQLASLKRQSLQDISQKFKLQLPPLLCAIKRNSYLMSLPFNLNEYTLVDTWDALRTHLYAHKPNPKTKMQRVRARCGCGDQVAQSDPVFYATNHGIDPSTARLY